MKKLTTRRHIKQAENYLASVSPEFQRAIEMFGRCTIKPWLNDPFGTLITSIVSQQLSTKAAATIVQRVYTGLNSTCFTPKQLLKATPDQLRSYGLSYAKASYVLGIASTVKKRAKWWGELQNAPPESIINELVTLNGVGQWTAEMLLIFGFGFSDVWSYGDLGLKKSVQKIANLDQMPTQIEFESLSKPWQPYRSIASWYLWRLV